MSQIPKKEEVGESMRLFSVLPMLSVVKWEGDGFSLKGLDCISFWAVHGQLEQEQFLLL